MNSLRTKHLQEMQFGELEKEATDEMYLKMEQDYLEQQLEMELVRELKEELNEKNVR